MPRRKLRHRSRSTKRVASYREKALPEEGQEETWAGEDWKEDRDLVDMLEKYKESKQKYGVVMPSRTMKNIPDDPYDQLED